MIGADILCISFVFLFNFLFNLTNTPNKNNRLVREDKVTTFGFNKIINKGEFYNISHIGGCITCLVEKLLVSTQNGGLFLKGFRVIFNRYNAPPVLLLEFMAYEILAL